MNSFINLVSTSSKHCKSLNRRIILAVKTGVNSRKGLTVQRVNYLLRVVRWWPDWHFWSTWLILLPPPPCHQCCVKWNDLDLSRNFYNKNKVWEIKPSCLIFGCQCNLKIFFQFLPMYSFLSLCYLNFFLDFYFYCFLLLFCYFLLVFTFFY